MPGLRWSREGPPLRCSTRRRGLQPKNEVPWLRIRPGSQIKQALTYCDLGLSRSVGRSAELFPEAALNQTGETPD
jgi:hypothetical protein